MTITLNLPVVETLQHAVQDPRTGRIYASQGIYETDDGETTVISELTADGELVSWSRMVNAGHGTLIGLQVTDDEPWVWLNWNTPGASDLVRIRWQGTDGQPVPRDAAEVVCQQFTTGYVLAVLDTDHDRLVLRRRIGEQAWYDLRHLTEALAGVDNLIATAGPYSVSDPVEQGAAIYDGTLYRLTGNTGHTMPPTLWVRDMFTAGYPTTYATGYAETGDTAIPITLEPNEEPEGVYVTAAQVLVGATKHQGAARTHRLYAYSRGASMRATVKAAWFDSIRSYEGYTTWLYFDSHNPPLATTGVGNMIDAGGSLSAFGLALPWRYKNGDYATEKQIGSEYTRLKALGLTGSGYAYEKHADLFLDKPVIEWMVTLKTGEFWNTLQARLPHIEDWPADAQLALLNMAWWMGPNFLTSWPTLTAALKAQDWIRASQSCTTVNPSQRNPDNVRRFTNAAKVVFADLDFTPLWDDKPVTIKFTGEVNALAKISAGVVATTRPSEFNIHGWYVQRMLTQTGDYRTTIDGLFGAMSKAAFTAWATRTKQPTTKVTKDTLTALSKVTLNIPVTA